MNLKKIICVLLLGLCISGIGLAQEQENLWAGTLRFDIADNFINLHNALPGISVTWTPYVLPNLGIQNQIDTHIGWGVLPGVQIALLSGIEYFPIRQPDNDINGFFIIGKIGFSLFILDGIESSFVAKTSAGYQVLTGRGLLFAPATGVVYNQRTGLGFNLILDIGFAYRRNR